MLLKYSPTCLLVGALLASTCQLHAQTETDAIMMNRTQFCAGFLYNHSSWNEYWEGTRKRNNLNLGTVTNQSVMFMANYGITDNLNVMVGAPYVWTNASAGTLKGMKGVQDLSLNVKWRALNYAINKKVNWPCMPSAVSPHRSKTMSSTICHCRSAWAVPISPAGSW